MPVDTHVHQIAHKHYGVRMASGGKTGKVAMTAKLYDEVSTKLADVWGEYAGWAHSVSTARYFTNFTDSLSRSCLLQT